MAKQCIGMHLAAEASGLSLVRTVRTKHARVSAYTTCAAYGTAAAMVHLLPPTHLGQAHPPPPNTLPSQPRARQTTTTRTHPPIGRPPLCDPHTFHNTGPMQHVPHQPRCHSHARPRAHRRRAPLAAPPGRPAAALCTATTSYRRLHGPAAPSEGWAPPTSHACRCLAERSSAKAGQAR